MVSLDSFKGSSETMHPQRILSSRAAFKKNISRIVLLVLFYKLSCFSVVAESDFNNDAARTKTSFLLQQAEDWHLSECFQNKLFNLVFLYDVSAVANERSQSGNVLEFFENIIQVLDVGKQKNNVNLISFDSQVRKRLNVNTCEGRQCLEEFVESTRVPKMKNELKLSRALRYVRRQFLNVTSRRRARFRNPFIIVLVVDETPSDSPVFVSSFLRSAGARIISVVYKQPNTTILRAVTSKPIKDNLFKFKFGSSLPSEGASTITSLLCEEISNKLIIKSQKDRVSALKKTARAKFSSQLLLRLKSVRSSSSSIRLSWKYPSFRPTEYRISHYPHHGVTWRINTTAIFEGLRPSTIYKITIQPFFRSIAGLPTTFVFTTAPREIYNISVDPVYLSTSQVQERLKGRYPVPLGVDMTTGRNITILEVTWNADSSQFLYEAYTVPSTPIFTNLPKKSNRRLFIDTSPGTHYTVYVVTRLPRQRRPVVSTASVITPPSPPVDVEIHQTDLTSLTISWSSPQRGIFDSFLLMVESVYGRSINVIEAPTDFLNNPIRTNRSFTHAVSNVLLATNYRVKVYSRSGGILSNLYGSASLVTNAHNDESNNVIENLQNSLLISSSDGIYSFALGSLDSGRSDDQDNSPSIELIRSVPSGVVNAIYHRQLRKHSAIQPQPNRWTEMIVWIDRKSREIMITTLGSNTRTTTFLSGLLQPIGLAIDNNDRNLYWADIASKCIGVASLNYPGFPDEPTQKFNKRLISGGGMSVPISLAIDSVNRRLFWGDYIGRIEESSMNGEGRSLLVNDTTLRPYALTYCIACNRLYWVNAIADRLEAFAFDGSGHQIILEEVTGRTSGITFLTSFRNDLIWMNSETLLLKKSDELKFSKSDGSPNIHVLNSVLGIPDVTSINAYDHLPYERAILDINDQTTFPCFNGQHACPEVCISTAQTETFCTGQCYPWEMLCFSSGQTENHKHCVSNLVTCDGQADCPNREDEELPECSTAPDTQPCQAFALLHGVEAVQCETSRKCIPASSVCDGRIDCREGSDEKDCPVQEQFCDFERHLCLWTQESDDNFDWSIHSGRTPSELTGPALDHTLINTNSSYIYIEATDQDMGARAILSSVWLARPVCIKFFYHMLGTSVGSLSLMYKTLTGSGDHVEVWSKDGNHGVFWKTARVSINYHGLYQLLFVATRGMDFRGDIALDDVTISDGLCALSRSCTFEGHDDSICGYELPDSDYAGWRIWSGPTPSIGTGPFPYNHHMEEVVEPELTSPLDLLGPGWFYYDFTSDDIPGCNACNGTRLVRKLSGFDEPTLVGIILCDNNKYKIFLGDDLHGIFRNIADGLGRGEDHCEFIQTTPGEASEVGDYTQCQGASGYVRHAWSEPVTLEAFGYGRAFGVSPAYYKCDLIVPQEVIDNEPSKRIARRPDRYLYVESDELEEGETTTFIIPVFMTRKGSNSSNPADTQSMEVENLNNSSRNVAARKHVTALTFARWCLAFRYHMHGRDIGSLRVSVEDGTRIWSKDGDQGPDWQVAKVTIPFPTVQYDVRFTAAGGGGEVGDIAVDDVTIQEYSCHPPQNYACEFNSHVVNECAFSLLQKADHFAYIKVDKLFERQSFDPVVIENRVRSSGVLIYTGPKLSNIDWQPSLQSPVLPLLSSFYPTICLTVNYMQRLSKGNLSVVLRQVETDRSITLSHYQLPEVADINPWLSMATEVNSSIELANTGPFVLEFYGVEAIYVDYISIATHPCPTVMEGFCNNAVPCGNNVCVEQESLCDGYNDCGDWSDEIGCPSYCGNVADVFGEEHIIINASLQHSSGHNQCVWRIHGDSNKNILMDVAVVDYSRNDKFTLTVYQDFVSRGSSGRNKTLMFQNETQLLFKNNFKKPSKYMIKSSQATVVLQFKKHSTLALVSLRVSHVGDNHCNYLCPDHYCVTDNYECDGISGCPDGSDEMTCTRFNDGFEEKLFEVKRREGEYSAICGDDVTISVANAACIQGGFSKATEPLRFAPLPNGYKEPHKLQSRVTQEIPKYIQAHVVPSPNTQFSEKRNDGEDSCSSSNTWIADCVPYQCGVKSVKASVNPILRIVGGTASRRAFWPWVVSLMVQHDHKCGGTLISDKFVLTAAHCFDFDTPDSFIIVIGANNLEPMDEEARIFTIKRDILHDNYDKHAGIPDWDIALLELNKPVTFSPFISPVCLPTAEARLRPGKKCMIIGYGHLVTRGDDPNRLYEVESPLLTHEQCNLGNYAGNISPRMMCAGYPDVGQKGFCFGDSGGPLLCETDDERWTLTGIVSWSFGCALIANPDVFTDVQYFTEWLNINANLNLPIPEFLKNGTCGGLFTRESGSIRSPGWPGKYPGDQECVYRILGGLGQTIRLKFETLDTEGRHYDAVEVFGGGTHLNNSLGYFSGHFSGDPDLSFEVNGQNMEVVFYSDSETSDRGFYATYTISGTEEHYKGPVFPIEVSHGEENSVDVLNILLSFTGVYVPDGARNGSRPSYTQEEPILLLDGSMVRNTLYYNDTTGQWKFVNPDSGDTGNYLYANDSAVTPDLAKVQWGVLTETLHVNTTLRVEVRPNSTMLTTTPLPGSEPIARPPEPISQPANVSSCFFSLTDRQGVIESPGFPEQINRSCSWHIMPEYNSSKTEINRIILVVEYFKTESVLNLFAGKDDESQRPLHSITGTVFPDKTFLSSYNKSSPMDKIESQTSSQTNNGQIETSPGSEEDTSSNGMSAPSCADSATSFSNSDCSDATYTLFSSLNATNFLLDCGLLIRCSNVSWCNLNNFLERYDQDQISPAMLVQAVETFCRYPNREFPAIATRVFPTETGPSEEESSGQGMPTANSTSTSTKKTVLIYKDRAREGITLSLINDWSSSEKEGFFLRYFVEEGEISVYREDEYIIININQQVPHQMSKRAVPGIFSLLPLPQSATSQLLSGNPSLVNPPPPSFQSLLSPTPPSFNPPEPAPRTSTFLERGSPRIAISLSPYSSPPCSRTTTLLDSSFSSWIVTSPNFPEPYGVNTNCTWTILTGEGYGIVLTFTDLLLEDHRTCNYDSVTLYDGETVSDPIIGDFCYDTFNSLGTQESSGSAMTIYFFSDNVVTNTGFRATVTSQPLAQVGDASMERELFRCDFSSHYCGFTNEPATPEFTWTRHRFTTSSDNTGPNYDASTDRQGHYLYIEGSSPRVAGDRARILSPTIQSEPDVPVCLRFVHDMHGVTIGFLNVYVIVHLSRNHSGSIFEGDGTESVVSTKPLVYLYGVGVGKKERDVENATITSQQYLLWSKYGEQRRRNEESWNEAAITFYPFNDFQIMFEGVRGFGYQSDIAIDNILVTQGECANECEFGEGYYTCSVVSEDPLSGECIPMELVCDGKSDCRSGSDEETCFSAFRNLCATDTNVLPNTTAEDICSNEVVDRCSLRSPSLTRVNNILCDGVFDCFGGYDESQCSDQPDIQGEFTTVDHLNADCGYQVAEVTEEVKTNYPNASALNHWPWVAGLYVATPSVEVAAVEEADEEDDNDGSATKLSGYAFLCSAVFITQEWVVVPAHCLLNPDSYDDYVSAGQHQTPQGSQSDVEEGYNELHEINEAVVQEGPKEAPGFSYAIITPNFPGSSVSRSAWKVNKWILHPKYKSNLKEGFVFSGGNNDANEERNATNEDDFILDQLKADSAMINFDIALLQVEPDDDILLEGEGVVVEVTEFVTDIEDVDSDGVYPIFYDTEMNSVNSTVKMETSSACLEIFESSTNLGERGNTRDPEIDSGVFKLPLEEQRFGINVPFEGTSPNRATCIVVGHSPVFTRSSEDDDQRLLWGLRHLETPVTSADVTSYFVYCESYSDLQMRKKCVAALTAPTTTSDDPPHIHVLMRTGYHSKRVASFVHDQGTVVLCKRHDEKWFLAATYNWVNLRRNLITPDFHGYIERRQTTPGQSFPPVVGIPLGTDYFTKLTPSLNEWISKTLQVACPGEFSCFPSESSISRCVTFDKVCDGIIDCPENYADEMECDSGCFYDPLSDPFYQYYNNLRKADVTIPEQIAPQTLRKEMDEKTAWRSNTNIEDGIQTIKINRVKGKELKSCHWSILPPSGKIAVIKVPKMNSNPLLDEGKVQIISENKRIINDWSTGPHYYSSLPDQPITFLLAANPDAKYLSKIRTIHFDYYVEDPTTCSERHRCGSGKCVAPDKVCDGELDCDDLSDEINCPSGCDGLSLFFGVQQGRISSRNYPFPHTGNGDCTWVILAQRDTTTSLGRTITVEFSDFVTSPLDEVHVFIGVGKRKRIHGIYSTSLSSFNVTIPAEQATLQLRSNDGIADRRINGRFHISNIKENFNRYDLIV